MSLAQLQDRTPRPPEGTLRYWRHLGLIHWPAPRLGAVAVDRLDRLRLGVYDEQIKGWTLYWFDRSSRAHVYDLLEPGQQIERLLVEYDDDPTCIFKG